MTRVKAKKEAKKRKKENQEVDDFDVRVQHNPQFATHNSAFFGGLDYSRMSLKADHENRPLWVCGNMHIFLEVAHCMRH